MEIQTESRPIGSVQEIPELEIKIKSLIDQWDEKIKDVAIKWYHSWGLRSKATLALATSFLLGALDELITTVDELIDNGPDKKATVLNGLDRLYEYVIREALPIWLRPFAGAVKQYVIYSLASNAIDYIVLKYRNGSWKFKTGG